MQSTNEFRKNNRMKKITKINAREFDIISMKFSVQIHLQSNPIQEMNKANDYSKLHIGNIDPIRFLRDDLIIHSEVLPIICPDPVNMISRRSLHDENVFLQFI